LKLHITRNQAKGLLGNVKFELNSKVELTDEEEKLIKKYNTNQETLFVGKVNILGIELNVRITIDNLVKGHTFKCSNIAEIVRYEAIVRDSCGTFKNYLEVMKDFGGEDVFEY